MTNNWKYVLMMAIAFPSAAAVAQTGDAGRRAIDLERYQEAKGIYKSQLNGKNADEAYFSLGDVYLRTENVDSAAYYFNQGIAKNKKSSINMVGLGKIALKKGDRAGALNQFEQAVKASKGKDPFVLTMAAEAYVNDEASTDQELNKAVEYLEQAIARDANNAVANVILGDARRRLKNSGGAMSAYDRATQIDPNYAKAYLRRGQVYTNSKNLGEAETNFKKVLEIDPNYAPAYRDLGELYFFAGQYDRALSTFQQYVNMAEKTPETQAKYASFLFLTKNYEQTLAEAQQVLQKQPDNVTMNRLVAYSYLELKQPEKALQAIENYFNKVDENRLVAEDYEYYAKILGRNKKEQQAVDAYKKALSIEPKPELYSELANLYVSLEKYDEAIKTYEEKREKTEPLNADYFYMGNIYMQSGDFKKADEMFANVTEAAPTYAYGHLWRAQANANLDPDSEKGLAKPHYEEFIKIASAEPEKFKTELAQANYYLGAYYYLVESDRQKAIQHFQEVKKLDPSNAQATAALAEINKSAQKKRK
ncbi:tetratricopeptide repeat protein [Pontibacter sp. SGAir0037]|uniref:tetratricopeptide repeat protein n=1 Tax=Pontibacter sp. SGAir0037 TaxID=2571030 RepID=UPI0010CCCD26|nr:tetratricopeptide repeat protein [Pontibacter sp. SGAir0037]QCR24300.1 hypothetical protein C1N53_19355 [Pontibacter sp. SGAir0037]